MADPNADPSYVPIPFPAVYYRPSGPPVTVQTASAAAALDPVYVPVPVVPSPAVLVQQANLAADLAAVTVLAVPPSPTDLVPVPAPVLVIVDNTTGEIITNG